MTMAPPKPFQLSVKFLGGANLILGEFNTHEDAVLSARRFYEFHIASHASAHTNRQFYNFFQDSDTLVVMEKYNNAYHPEGMFMVLKIKEFPKKESSYWTGA
jgi:hypothetical protein